jgi:lipopolysaccharide export LptBFGC system permease protein LptF
MGMTRAKVFWVLAIVANALGWALPVIEDNQRVYRGVHAFRVALSPLWPYEQFRMPAGYMTWLSIASALTNVVFVVMAAYLWPQVARATGSRVGVFVLGGAALLDLHWTVTMQENAADLAIGYYVWVASFVLLLLAVHPALAGRRP